MTTVTRLRLPDEARAIACLQPYRVDDAWCAPDGCAIDVIGVMYAPGPLADDGTEIGAPTPLDGWHVNVFGPIPAKGIPFIVTPATPRRVFAGEDA